MTEKSLSVCVCVRVCGSVENTALHTKQKGGGASEGRGVYLFTDTKPQARCQQPGSQHGLQQQVHSKNEFCTPIFVINCLL